jgi:hypothetical protein
MNLIRFILVLFVVMILAIGLSAGGALLMRGGQQEMSYTTLNGPCQLRVYDDPLYAEHWAKNVNTPNCDAIKVQSEAQNIDANTRSIDAQTKQSNVAVYLIGAVFLGVIGFFVYAILKS